MGEDQTPPDRGAFGHIFDRDAEVEIGSHDLPHWMQNGTITFVTFRLADSLPREIIENWNREKLEFLACHGIHCTDWRIGRRGLGDMDRRNFDKQFDRKKHNELDSSHGRCQLRNSDAAELVCSSLLHFDNDRYFMGDFVVMPNHVHLLVVFPNAKLLRKQCYSWRHFTAVQINRFNGETGTLWQGESFDHLVRSEKQVEYLRGYIQENPVNAFLSTDASVIKQNA